MVQSHLFPGIADWLLDRAVRQTPTAEAIRDLGQKLLAGGVAVSRISVGNILLHPVLGALDAIWHAEDDTCRSELHPRSALDAPRFTNSPFFYQIESGQPFRRYRLTEPETRKAFPLLEKLHSFGTTDYLVFYTGFEKPIRRRRADLPYASECALASFATKRNSGFTDDEVENLRSLALPLALVVKTAASETFARALLDTYIGRLSGTKILSGQIQKGDGEVIDCALWFSDMRGSTALAAELDIYSYFDTINTYFDCTAGAVLDQGGEVLKLIGDGVMAIFPIDEAGRTAADMCLAAATTAREALARAEAINAARADGGQAPIAFGIGLHRGKVLYGNVGTERRMDMTVTGPAANIVARLESLCRPLGLPVIASAAFADRYARPMAGLGDHALDGMAAPQPVFTFEDLATRSVGIP